MPRKMFVLVGLVLIIAIALTGCGTTATTAVQPTTKPADTQAAEVPTVQVAEPSTIEWWHITTAEDQKAVWQKLADEYIALHPEVTINITVLENEAFKTKLTTTMQSGADIPDIFQSWGGGTMNEYATAGLLRNITAELDADGSAWRNTFGQGALGVYSLDGQNYGVPWDMGMVGVFYNQALFDKAGVASFPANWTELMAAIEKFKAANIVPMTTGGGDKWPSAFIYEYLATRIGGQAGFMAASNRTGAFTDAPFVQAGEKLVELVDANAFQPGFLGETWGNEATHMGNGEAAMDVMGQWGQGSYNDNSVDKLGIGENLKWAPFPVVEGGAGDPNDALGGGNGFAVGKDAPDSAVDFLKYLTRAESQVACATAGFVIPVVKGGEAGLTDPLMIAIQQQLAKAVYFQLYYDQYLPPAMGSVVNDTVQAIMAKTMTPAEGAQAIEDAAKTEIK